MGAKQAYDLRVRRLNRASVAGLALALLSCLPSALAQVHGVPTSVTSIGFGGHFDRMPGIRPSVTSLGPRGYDDPSHRFTGFGFVPGPVQQRPGRSHAGQSAHHHHRGNGFPGVGEVYAVPYYVPAYAVDPDETADDEPEPASPAGPTIFDRRATGQSSQTAEANYEEQLLRERRQVTQRDTAPQPADGTASAPVSEQSPTVLVFKDGHQLEVQNYAIVGSTLFDLSAGHRNKIALADLDMQSTAKQNDDRGIDFQLPAQSETN